MFEADWWLGRRFEFADKTAPDMTIVALDKRKGIRVHGADGSRAWLPARELQAAVEMGILLESKAAPFVWDRQTHT